MSILRQELINLDEADGWIHLAQAQSGLATIDAMPSALSAGNRHASKANVPACTASSVETSAYGSLQDDLRRKVQIHRQ